MDLGEALTFETRRGAEQLERTVRDINRLEAMPATPVRLNPTPLIQNSFRTRKAPTLPTPVMNPCVTLINNPLHAPASVSLA